MPCDASQHPRNPRAPRLLPVALSFQSSRSGVDWLRCPCPHNTTETLIPALECADEEFVTLPSRGKAAAQCPLGGVVDPRNRLNGLKLPRYGVVGSIRPALVVSSGHRKVAPVRPSMPCNRLCRGRYFVLSVAAAAGQLGCGKGVNLACGVAARQIN